MLGLEMEGMVMTMFYLTIDRVKKMKRLAQLAAPHVQTGHRIEIVARFLGWRTYASLLHDLRASGRCIDRVDFTRAMDFCAQIDVDLVESDLEHLSETLEYEFGDVPEESAS